jgi:hypothetical protein
MINTKYLDDMIAKLSSFDVEGSIRKATESYSVEAAALNVDQLESGISSLGTPTPNYSPRGKKRGRGRITFKETGAYHKSIRAVVTKTGRLSMTSSDKKAKYLRNYKGKTRTLGLTKKSMSKLKPRVLAKFKSIFTNHMK